MISSRAPDQTLHCGNSGTTARLLLGLLAAHPFETRLTGDQSLRRRPMRRVTEPLARMGATVVEERGGGLPLRIRGGALEGLDWDLPVATAQVTTALLFAGLAAGVRVAVREPAVSRDHTERMLRALGAPLRVEDGLVILEPAPGWLAACPALDWQVAGDASSAAFLVAATLLATGGVLGVCDVGMNPTLRHQSLGGQRPGDEGSLPGAEARRPVCRFGRGCARRCASRDSEKRRALDWLCRRGFGGEGVSREAPRRGIRERRYRANPDIPGGGCTRIPEERRHLDADSIALEVDGKFASAFIRARKPGAAERLSTSTMSLQVFDPAMCCSTGVCGPAVDPQ